MSRSKSLISKILLIALILTLTGRVQPGLTQARMAPTVEVFTNSLQSLGGETANGVALGDLDGDGDADALVANDANSQEGNQVWLNQGNGSFTAGQQLGSEDGYAIAVGDLDGDGDLDAVIARGTTVSAEVWINQGGAQGGSPGSFTAGASLGSLTGYGVALGDVDDDGDQDALVVGNSNQVWLNNGNATFSAGPSFPYQYSKSVALADLDGDGFLDAVIADSANGSNNRVWWNDGNWNPGPGTFTQGAALPTASLINGVAAGDLDGDERTDIFLAGVGQEQVYWNEGSRNLIPGDLFSPSDNSSAVTLADVDLDDDLDAVIGNITSDPNRLWQNLGGRSFSVAQEFGDEFGLYWSRGLALADLNGDGPVDLFDVTTAEDRVWFNTSAAPVTPNQEGWQRQAVDTRGDTGLQPSLALDANGNPHISYITAVVRDYDNEIGYLYNYYLRYAHWDGVRWHLENLSSGGFIADTALALDSNGYPHIAFLGPARLGYLRWIGASWQQIYVPIFNEEAFDFTLDSNNNPHFAFVYGFPNSELRYLYLENGAWISETISLDGNVNKISLELDGNNNPHVIYHRQFDGGLFYAHRATTWLVEVIDANVYEPFGFSDLALDAAGTPHIAYGAWGAGTPNDLVYTHKVGNTWQPENVDTPILGSDFEDVSLSIDSVEVPHLFYTLVDDYTNTGTYFKYAIRQASSWQISTLDHNDNVDPDMITPASAALDADDRLHAAYRDARYADLRYISWDLDWQLRPLPETGVIRSTALDLETTAPSFAYYNQTGGQVKLASWDTGWDVNPLDFVNNPVDDLSVAAGFTSRHVSYYDADNQRLIYSVWNGSSWTSEIVDEAGDVGRYNELLLVGNADGAARIVYWDDTTRRIKLARPVLNSVLWDIFPNLAAPALDADSGPLSAAIFPGGHVGVSYYDGTSGDLRLAVWSNITNDWSDERVDGLSGDVGSLSSLRIDSSEGTPVVAYLGEGTIRYAYKLGSLWQVQDVPGTSGEAITGLSLELGLNSRQHARIAYITASGELNVALLRNGIWRNEVIAAAGEAAGAASSALDTRLHLAYSRLAGGLSYAFRTATLDIDTTLPGVPPPAFFEDGYYNPLDACQALLDVFATPSSQLSSAGTHETAALQPPVPETGSLLDDHHLFNAMTALFENTPGGQRYISLYRQHGAEMGRIGLQDPSLLWDAYGTLQNFIPGIAALVTGQGRNQLVTQEMVDDALDIWQRLAAAGSPALAATINSELAAYNNLQDFVGLSFDQWAQAIGVQPPQVIHLPLISR